MERLAEIEKRIRQILSDQQEYQFTPAMDAIAKAFLTLTLELQDLGDFNRMAVLMPKVVLGWEAALYLARENSWAELAASTSPDLMLRREQGETITIDLAEEMKITDGCHVFPLRSSNTAPANPEQDNRAIIGMLSLCPNGIPDPEHLFFINKFADLVALSLAQRLLARKNQQHLDFIKKLVADIGHNVIVPNIFFKVYLRRLKGKMDRLKEIQAQLAGLERPGMSPTGFTENLRELSDEMAYANEGLQEEFDHIEKHYVNTSLFLETLLRQSHFEKGRYVLQKKTCNFRRDIIEPQIDRFERRLTERHIEIDLSAGGVPDQVIEAVVDVGLISQVFANLISNAVKYTRPVYDKGYERRFIAYGLELVKDAFGLGADGVKLNLFSSGWPLPPEEREKIFEEGYRGSNIEGEHGTGHGLSFVREVVRLHGGRAGYEATEKGSNFYLILPK